MKRREFLKASLAGSLVGGVAPGSMGGADETSWDSGIVYHLLPTVSHDRILIKTSLTQARKNATGLRIGRRTWDGIRADTDGLFWVFQAEGLEPDTDYELQMVGAGGERLCAPWPLRTFPAPGQPKESLRLLIYTCAGGHDALKRDGGTRFVATGLRRALLERGVSYHPDAVISIGDHVYWDLRAGRSAASLGASEAAIRHAGEFDRTAPVIGTPNERVLKAAVGPQVADLYRTVLRSIPVFFYQDDHDYFENDHADDEIVTFPPDSFMLRLGRASQWLYYPEFLPDHARPRGLASSSAPDRTEGVSECYGTLRYGNLFEGLMYDCLRHLSLKGPSAVFVEPEAENWLVRRMANSSARHVINFPSTPIGWTAGKWAEWYPDVLNEEGKLTTDRPKPYWQPGWRSQHDRLAKAASEMNRLPLFISGDIHSLGHTRINRYGSLDVSRNPVHSILSGPLGTGPMGWPSAFRGTRALTPVGAEVEETLPCLEENGFILADFTPDDVTIRFFRWLPERGANAIEGLEPFHSVTLKA